MDRRGRILVPGINEAVAPVTEEELELYDKIDFDLEEYACDVGTDTLLHGCKVRPADAVTGASSRPPDVPMQGTPREGARDSGVCVCACACTCVCTCVCGCVSEPRAGRSQAEGWEVFGNIRF